MKTDTPTPLPQRLADLADQLEALIAEHRPDGAAVEEVFVNKNPQSTLKLGQARGVALMLAARAGIAVGEYAARLVKKAVVGNGNAEKVQVHAMVGRLLPGVKIAGPDAADALAVAITHAHHLASARRIAGSVRGEMIAPPHRNPRRNQRRRRGDRRRRRRLSRLCSARTLDALGPVGGEVLLLTEMQVREDSMTLFGFGTAGEREAFRALTSVQGVGGRVALAILSALGPDELARAVVKATRR